MQLSFEKCLYGMYCFIISLSTYLCHTISSGFLDSVYFSLRVCLFVCLFFAQSIDHCLFSSLLRTFTFMVGIQDHGGVSRSYTNLLLGPIWNYN